ncbi:transmembrane protein, putative (macronuclear) [Tetrahymena thermophila SB210]|uniref:Transmembrane protein, putative n=1 Tax=Tetrahymena thermophila (strain SB210) TaxID=312017 RepID=W7XIG5_TETTS|nr:transmembrane protein, putative [Tetrahymena thermophila SB210]EWS73274.1 transmembrane protein, putative [Tetrahymena thermophila SB210]|eukprot:XP_012654183.1 transmembrane protein, putative [Tetrahymena thermophila SB210]
MKFKLFFLIFYAYFKQYLANQCDENQIFDLTTQSCIQCSNQCQSCFNNDNESCIKCAQQYIFSSTNRSVCVQNCLIGETLNDQNQCIKCQVPGCIKCLSNQECTQCDANLTLDSINNKCIVNKNNCQERSDFVYYPYSANQCTQNCPTQYYQNKQTQICEQTQQCLTINQRSDFSFNKTVLEIQPLSQNLYLMRAMECNFAIVDINMNIISKFILQDIPNYSSIYLKGAGTEPNTQSFISGYYGGCAAGSRLQVMNFQTLQIEFDQSGLQYDYYIHLVDSINQLVFLYAGSYTSNTNGLKSLVWYDILNKQINQLNLNSSYTMQDYYVQYPIAKYYLLLQSQKMQSTLTLQQNRTFILSNYTDAQFNLTKSFTIIQNTPIFANFTLAYYQNPKQVIIQKLVILQNQTLNNQTIQILDISGNYYNFLFSQVTNSIVVYNSSSNNISLMILDPQITQVQQIILLTQYQIANFYIFEETSLKKSILYISNSQMDYFIDITGFLSNNNQNNTNLQNLMQQIDKTYNLQFISSSYPTVFIKENNIVQLFYLIQNYGVSYIQLVNLQYNMTDLSLKDQLLDPYQYNIFYYNTTQTYSSLVLYSSMFTTQNLTDKNSFYLYSSKQNIINPILGVQKISYYLPNLQKNPRKDGNVIDINNMVIIKSNLEDNNYLGQTLIGDSEIHYFESQNGIYWHKNIFNRPLRVLNLTQNYIIQVNMLQENQNNLLMYDNQAKLLLFYDISQHFSKIIVAQIQGGSLFSINIKLKSKTQITINSSYTFGYQLQCENNLVIISYPTLQLYYFNGKPFQFQFQKINIAQVTQNTQHSYALVDIKNELIVYFYDVNYQLFIRENFVLNSYIMDYVIDETNFFYDVDLDILISTTGSLQQISYKSVIQNGNLNNYKTASSFAKGSTYFYKKQATVIVVDKTPIMYLCNYQSQEVNKFDFEFNDTQGILMDENKNMIFIYTSYFIVIIQYPQMQFIETFTLQAYDSSSIINVYLNEQFHILTVYSKNTITCFDLIEVLYTTEINLMKYQDTQNIILTNEYQVYYSLVNFSLNLFKGSTLIDTLLFKPSTYNIFPYFTQPLLVSPTSFLYIVFDMLFVINVDLQIYKLQIAQQINLQNVPDNYFLDSPRKQILLLYKQNFQLSSVDLTQNNLKEVNLTSLTQIDISQAFIISKYIVLPTINQLTIYSIENNKQSQILLSPEQVIQFSFKIQQKQIENYKSNLWNIPFDFEERINLNDQTLQGQSSTLIFIVSKLNSNSLLQIFDLVSQQIIQSIQFNNIDIMNVISDPFRQLVYAVTNEGQTYVYNMSLQLISILQNACLKQARITFDQNFIYSVCPMDIIIYNSLSFQQQFPAINYGLVEANNIININFNYHFLIIQKSQIMLVKLSTTSTNYEIVFQNNQNFPVLQTLDLFQGSNGSVILTLLVTSYQNIQKIIIPLTNDNSFSIQIQQQNRALEYVYTQSQINQILTSLKSSQNILSVIEINYLNGQCIQNIESQNFQNLKSSTQYELTLISKSNQLQNLICWQDTYNNFQYIKNFYVYQMTLSLNEVSLNQNGMMKNFQMQNVNLTVNQSLIIANLNSVYLQDIIINQGVNGQLNQISITNCTQVLIDSIFMNSLYASQQFAFYIKNVTEVIIRNIYIQNSSHIQVFYLYQILSLATYNISIIQSQNINLINTTLTNNISATGFYINHVTNSYILYAQGVVTVKIQQVKINQSQEIFMIQQEPLELIGISYTCQVYSLSYLEIQNSSDIYFNSISSISNYYNLNLKQINSLNNIFTLQSTLIQMEYIEMNNILSQNNSFVFSITNFQDCFIQNLSSLNCSTSIIFLGQQKSGGQVVISQSSLKDNSIDGFHGDNSLINLQDILYFTLKQTKILKNKVINNQLSSILKISQTNNVNITDCKFTNNFNQNGQGGSVLVSNANQIYIQDSSFQNNICKQKNGGAIYFMNTVNVGKLEISNTNFIFNQAALSTGGAISLDFVNLIMHQTQLYSNKALIGGAIYYSQVIPDFVLEYQQGINNSNQIKNNYAKLYGMNIGSVLRQIKIDASNISLNRGKVSYNGQTVSINNAKSGEEIIFSKIQLLDEENHPIYVPIPTEQIDYSSDVQLILRQLSVSIECEQNKQIQCSGQLQSKQYINGGYNLRVQPMYMPFKNMALQIMSNNQNQLIDSKGNIIISDNQLQLEVNIQLGQCSVGEVYKQFSESIICDMCPEGKYSLDLSENSCKTCPDSAIKCIGSNIYLKNGYWRQSNLTDEIIQCSFNSYSCQPQDPHSKFLCAEGYIGPLCYQCDTYGEIWGKRYAVLYSVGNCYKCEQSTKQIIINNLIIFLFIFFYLFFIIKNILKQFYIKLVGHYLTRCNILFLGTTCLSDRQEVFSKIMTDHIQVICLVVTFQTTFPFPFSFQFPFQVTGNSMSVVSKSIDCLFSQYPNLKPLWFYQILWSFILPFNIIFFLFFFGILTKNQNQFLKYKKTVIIFIYLYFFPMAITLLTRSLNCLDVGQKSYFDLDFTIQCFDENLHKPYVLYFSLPALIIWVIIIPVILYIKILREKNSKRSILFQIEYSFISVGYKEKYYYWEFLKLLYKALLILLSILLKQNVQLKVCMMNLVILINFYVVFKVKPFKKQYFNNLVQQSTLISALSLYFSSLSPDVLYENVVLQALFVIFVATLNILFIIKLVCGLIRLNIPAEKLDRNCLQEMFYTLKLKYPLLLENIKIDSKQRIRALIKLKSVQKKFRQFLKYLKNNNLYEQENFKSLFCSQQQSPQNKQLFALQSPTLQSPTLSNQIFTTSNQSIDTELRGLNTKLDNSSKNLRSKWAKYSKLSKQSSLKSRGENFQLALVNTKVHKKFSRQATASDNESQSIFAHVFDNQSSQMQESLVQNINFTNVVEQVQKQNEVESNNDNNHELHNIDHIE